MSKKKPGAAAIIAELRQTLDRLLTETDKPSLSVNARKALEVEIRKVINELGQFLNELDPIRQPSSVFDPSNPKIVGRFIALAMVAQPRYGLSDIDKFYGSGVYAIYYNGPFPLYARLSGSETPIYVGQAAPAINNARTPMEQGDKLCGRLVEHGKSIGKATGTLNIDDFEFRSLVVQSGWETAAEDYLIHLFRPIWNKETKILFGIGKHGDSAETRSNRRSPWDTIHQARTWAADAILSDAKSPDRIKAELDTHFVNYPVFKDLDSVLLSFIEELRQV
jgi:Eco29kI restriction endonuclease